MTTPDRKLCTNTTGELANASNDDLSREMHHFFGRALLAPFIHILSLRKLSGILVGHKYRISDGCRIRIAKNAPQEAQQTMVLAVVGNAFLGSGLRQTKMLRMKNAANEKCSSGRGSRKREAHYLAQFTRKEEEGSNKSGRRHGGNPTRQPPPPPTSVSSLCPPRQKGR